MADDKTNRGEPDRSKVSGSEDYELDYLARQNGMSREQARELVRRVGNNRDKLDEAAKRMKHRPHYRHSGCDSGWVHGCCCERSGGRPQARHLRGVLRQQ